MKLRFITLGLCVLICTTMLGTAADNTLTMGGSAAGAVAGSATISLGSSDNASTVENTTAADNATDNETAPVNTATDSVTAVVDNSTTTTDIASTSSNTTKTSTDLAAFLANDTTEDTPLDNINVPHPEYAGNLYLNATAAGFNASVKTVSFQNGCPADRSVVVFDTSDKGQIIIDDTGIVGGNALDKVVTQLEVGQMFKSSAFDGSCTKDYDRGIVATINDVQIDNTTSTTNQTVSV